MTGFQLRRLGQMMEPEPGNPLEVEGVTDPVAARGPDGYLYLFPVTPQPDSPNSSQSSRASRSSGSR
jgi:hypothetical protein